MTDPNEALLRAVSKTQIASTLQHSAQIISDAIAYPELLAVVEAARLEHHDVPTREDGETHCRCGKSKAGCHVYLALAAYDAKREEQG
jgi:hypothetical protein